MLEMKQKLLNTEDKQKIYSLKKEIEEVLSETKVLKDMYSQEKQLLKEENEKLQQKLESLHAKFKNEQASANYKEKLLKEENSKQFTDFLEKHKAG